MNWVDKKRKRILISLVFLGVLVSSAYLGASEPETRSVQAEIVSRLVVDRMCEEDTLREAQSLIEQRHTEVSMLDEIIDDEYVDKTTRERALGQKLMIIQNMEKEAQVLACLQSLGYEDVSVICGEQMSSVVLRLSNPLENSQSIQIVDAICSQIGIQNEELKIIISKK